MLSCFSHFFPLREVFSVLDAMCFAHPRVCLFVGVLHLFGVAAWSGHHALCPRLLPGLHYGSDQLRSKWRFPILWALLEFFNSFFTGKTFNRSMPVKGCMLLTGAPTLAKTSWLSTSKNIRFKSTSVVPWDTSDVQNIRRWDLRFDGESNKNAFGLW